MNNNNNGGYQLACASCKHQRKRCDVNCELAPYFPSNRYAEYQKAHRLFGYNNILKLVTSVEPSQREAVAESILMEGNARHDDPVHGSLGIIRDLGKQIEFHQGQLDIVNQQLSYYQERECMQQLQITIENNPSSSLVLTSSSLQHQLVASNHQSILEEGTNDEPFNMQSINPIIESNQYEYASTNIKESEESSATKNKGKQPMECDRDEEEENAIGLYELRERMDGHQA